MKMVIMMMMLMMMTMSNLFPVVNINCHNVIATGAKLAILLRKVLVISELQCLVWNTDGVLLERLL